MIGLENKLLQARRALKQQLQREPTVAEMAALVKAAPMEALRAWRLLNLKPAALQRHVEAAKELLTQEEYAVMRLRIDPQRGGIHSAEQVAQALGCSEEAVQHHQASAMAKLRAFRSPDLPDLM